METHEIVEEYEPFMTPGQYLVTGVIEFVLSVIILVMLFA